MILRREVPVDMQNEDRFSPRNTFAFNPFSQILLSYDNGILAGLLYLMARKNPAALERLASKLMANVSKMLGNILASGRGNPLAAINAHTTFACVAHRFGIIDDSHYLKIAGQTRSIIDKIFQLNAADIASSGILTGLSTLVEGVKGTSALPLERYTETLSIKSGQ